jgi:DNA-binding cell septation regulator SpoVG
MLNADDVRNTIEAILRQAAGRAIRFEVIEGTTVDEWHLIRDRRNRASEAMVAISEKRISTHHFEDVLNQIVSSVRVQIQGTKDRLYPQVRARLILEIAPTIAAAEEMLFDENDTHDNRRAFARAIDRIAGFLEVLPITLALEIERCHRAYAKERTDTGGETEQK